MRFLCPKQPNPLHPMIVINHDKNNEQCFSHRGMKRFPFSLKAIDFPPLSQRHSIKKKGICGASCPPTKASSNKPDEVKKSEKVRRKRTNENERETNKKGSCLFSDFFFFFFSFNFSPSLNIFCPNLLCAVTFCVCFEVALLSCLALESHRLKSSLGLVLKKNKEQVWRLFFLFFFFFISLHFIIFMFHIPLPFPFLPAMYLHYFFQCT